MTALRNALAVALFVAAALLPIRQDMGRRTEGCLPWDCAELAARNAALAREDSIVHGPISMSRTE